MTQEFQDRARMQSFTGSSLVNLTMNLRRKVTHACSCQPISGRVTEIKKGSLGCPFCLSYAASMALLAKLLEPTSGRRYDNHEN